MQNYNAFKARFQPGGDLYQGGTGTVGYTASSPDYSAGTTYNTSTGRVTGQILPQAASTTSYSSGSGGGGGGSAPAPEQVDPYAQLRNDISSGWDNYLGSLDSQLDSLSTQRGAQENIANSQYQQGLGQLDLQKTQGEQQLATQRERTQQNQTKTLRDLADNIRSGFLAGNVYLGARGAGDSSAANQYSYALTKLGTQQRSDITQNSANILENINQRETNLSNIYNQEVNNLRAQKDQQINAIASWFADAQRQIQNQQATGQLGKSQDLQNLSRDILNQAISAIQNVTQKASGQYNALQNWVQQVGSQIQQTKASLGNISDVSYAQPTSQPLTGTPQTDASGSNYYLPGNSYAGSNSEDLLKYLNA